MSWIPRVRNRHLLLLDVALLLVLPIAALALRLDGLARILTYVEPLLAYAVITLVIKLSVFYVFGLYTQYWHYASAEELGLIVRAVLTAGVVVSSLFILIAPYSAGLPRSLPFIDTLLTLAAVGAPRFGLRLLENQRKVSLVRNRRRVLIVGAGSAGQIIAREMRQNPAMGFNLVGFVDDDAHKQGLKIMGVPVLGGRARLAELVQQCKVDQVVIAMPSAPGSVVREVVKRCEDAGVQIRILPGLGDLLTGAVNVQRLRPVEIDDLLRRDAVKTDLATVHALVAGKVVLVTGAGGSIGCELCRQIASAGPAHLVMLGHGEFSIYQSHNALRKVYPNLAISPVIADVRDRNRLDEVFRAHRPAVVFHAAAHKHVPLMEANISEAITNNVLGSHFLLETALTYGSERFVLISTDKAVNPVNVMGVTKRLAELLVLDAARRSGHLYVAVRFGNVLGSRGSVVPLFKEQIERGGPVTITHPEVHRYFMTIPEAVQLVLQAAALGTGGDLFMLDMGEPIRILDLAMDLVRLSGLTPGEDIKIVFTGLRPGEKLQEELYQSHEMHMPTEHEKILRVTTKTQQSGDLLSVIPRLHALAAAGQVHEALQLMASLVAEYRVPSEYLDMPDIEPERRVRFPLNARWY